MNEQFLRTEMLLGHDALVRLSQCHVAVFGLGGVGSFCAEALARSGIGTLTLVDHDTISLSNLNRQLIALHSTIGQYKTQAMKARILDINPNCTVFLRTEQYRPENRDSFFAGSYDYIVDAIDMVTSKIDLIETALHRNIPILSAMGTGNKLDPSLFQVTDLSKTQGCSLARVLRKELGKRGIRHHKVVFSPELPRKPEELEVPAPGRRSTPASAPWVPPVAGFLLAGEVVQQLIGI